MKHFLIVYSRARGETLEVREFDGDRAPALRARFERELSERGNPDIEVVLLSADSRDTLERTHGRFFKTSEQLAQQLRSFVPA